MRPESAILISPKPVQPPGVQTRRRASYGLVNFVVRSRLLDMPTSGPPRVGGLRVLDLLFSLLRIHNTKSQSNPKRSF